MNKRLLLDGVFYFAVIIFLAYLLFGCSNGEKSDPPAGGAEGPKIVSPGPQKEKTGTVVGKVIYKGIPPVIKKLKTNKDTAVCGEEQTSEELVVNQQNNGISWAVASIKGHIRSGPIDQEKIIDQKGCRFQPHVLAIGVGDNVNILNSDGVLHNIHTFSVNNPPFNEAQPKFKKKITKTFSSAPEQIKIKCDVHGWMAGWIVVLQNPYYGVTNENGEFRIENVPVGRQQLEVWHETLGTALMDVEVEEGEVSQVDTLVWSLKFRDDKTSKKKGTVVAKPIFDSNCAACHGPFGKGDGPAAASLPNKPANLALDATQKKTDGELEVIIRDGRQLKGMPPWKNALTNQQIKDLVDYIRYLGGK